VVAAFLACAACPRSKPRHAAWVTGAADRVAESMGVTGVIAGDVVEASDSPRAGSMNVTL
jgi:hypothetical protein